MKRVLAVLLTVALVASMSTILVACGNKDGAEGTQDNQVEATQIPKEAGKAEVNALLKSVGLELSKIEPKEKYYRVGIRGEQITFYMEKDTKKDFGSYLHQIVDVCKKAADGKKLYKPDVNFFSKEKMNLMDKVPSTKKINEMIIYVSQYGYYHGDKAVTFTLSSNNGYDNQRNDGEYYPCYVVNISVSD